MTTTRSRSTARPRSPSTTMPSPASRPWGGGRSESMALTRAQTSDRPSLIACRTVIGYGAPTKAGTAATHGSALGKEEVAGAREKLGWHDEPFHIPQPILTAWRGFGARGAAQHAEWERRFAADPQREEFDRRILGNLPEGFDAAIERLKRE